MKTIKYLLFVYLSVFSLQSFASMENSNGCDVVDLSSDPHKKQTIVLTESKKVDEEIQAQLNDLLNDFMDEVDSAMTLVGTEDILSAAFDYEGVRYRFGGTTYSGIDCSGLVMNAFANTDLNLPRTSGELAQVGEKIKRNNAQKGDLIFFKTRGNRISHVGIITEVTPDDIKFIHSSTSRGVIVSSINETYYKNRFVQINRVLPEK